MKRKIICTAMIFVFLFNLFALSCSANEELSVMDYAYTPAWAQEQNAFANGLTDLGGKSAILMEETTGKVFYEKNADLKMPPASITKIMTLLLTMEAIERKELSLDTQITCSQHAASMGGAQIWLEQGEKMSIDDLLKAVCIKSANDAAVALAEAVSGSEEEFVSLMNKRAGELDMKNTTFKNASGLDADGHETTARDIAKMSRELMRHDKIFEYTKIWLDTLRDGKTELVNTNKLIRFYSGATGLKTGTTSKAGSCISATAKRDGLSLIAVVMGFENSTERNVAAKKLLDYGFSKLKLVEVKTDKQIPETVNVLGSDKETVKIKKEKAPTVLIEKDKANNLESKITIFENITAPVKKGDAVGKVEVYSADEKISEYSVTADEDADKLTFLKLFLIILSKIF